MVEYEIHILMIFETKNNISCFPFSVVLYNEVLEVLIESKKAFD